MDVFLRFSTWLCADDYVQSFRPFLMDVVYHWSKGASFAQICGMTEIMEGSIIRCGGGWKAQGGKHGVMEATAQQGVRQPTHPGRALVPC